MGLFEAVLRPTADRRDWVFVGFVALTVVASGYTTMQRVRFHRATATFAQCAADADRSCAAVALETMRSVDADQTRTRLAEAEMRVLSGDARTADALLARALRPASGRIKAVGATKSSIGVMLVLGDAPLSPLPGGDLDPDVLAKLAPVERGDALLVAGDIAAARGDADRATARWTEAAGIVDDSLVEPRQRRLADHRDQADAQLTGAVGSLRADFDRLFDAARDGSDGTAYSAAALRTRVRSVQPPLAAQKLTLAIDAADRCAKLTRARSISQNRPMLGAWSRPDPPLKPSEEDMAQNKYLRSSYERQMALYEQNVARWEAQRSDRDRARSFAEDEVSKTANDILAEARQLRDEGLALIAPATSDGR